MNKATEKRAKVKAVKGDLIPCPWCGNQDHYPPDASVESVLVCSHCCKPVVVDVVSPDQLSARFRKLEESDWHRLPSVEKLALWHLIHTTDLARSKSYWKN